MFDFRSRHNTYRFGSEVEGNERTPSVASIRLTVLIFRRCFPKDLLNASEAVLGAPAGS